MKKMLFYAASICLISACHNQRDSTTKTSNKEVVANVAGDLYSVDPISQITWTGSKPGGKHVGTLKIKEGIISVDGNAISGGNFIIDMLSFSDIDKAADVENKAKLEGHLKSPDFFNAEKYPNAKFEITSVEPITNDSIKTATHLIKGNLTIKDNTKNISFPAKVTLDEKNVTASADFNIDRTLWGINYKGPNNPQNWFISKEVNIKISISAAKK